VLGLALGAVLALSAMAASSASAIDTFTGPAGNIPITGLSHDNVFKITTTPAPTEVRCTTSHFSGTITNGTSHATITPTYTGRIGATPHTSAECDTTIGTAPIDMNGCDYDLTGTTTGVDEGLTDATVSVTCPTPSTHIIVTNSTGLKIKVPAQTPTSGGVTYTNGTGTVNVKATATGITYTCESAFLCGVAGIPTEGNNADYTGNVVVSSTAGNISWSGS
jgi:hypothetical protein